MGKKKEKVREITAPKRIERELALLLAYPYTLKAFRDLKVDPDYPLRWEALLIPENELYSDGAYRIEIVIPKDYPFKPPRILFLTKIHHPNIDSVGRVCLALITIEHWKPTTRLEQVIEALVALLNSPDPQDPISHELAEEYIRDFEKFKRIALSMTRKFAEKLPPELPPLKKKKTFGPAGKK